MKATPEGLTLENVRDLIDDVAFGPGGYMLHVVDISVGACPVDATCSGGAWVHAQDDMHGVVVRRCSACRRYVAIEDPKQLWPLWCRPELRGPDDVRDASLAVERHGRPYKGADDGWAWITAGMTAWAQWKRSPWGTFHARGGVATSGWAVYQAPTEAEFDALWLGAQFDPERAE